MTSGEPPNGPSATRIGGFTLIGIGALALVFGVASVFAGTSDTMADPSTDPGATSSRPASEPGSTSTATSSAKSTGASTTSEPTAESSAPTSPPQRVTSESRAPERTGNREGKSNSSGDSAQRVSLRVYNNSKIDNLAHRAAKDLRGAGYDVVEVGNYSGGRIPVTTVYYRPDTGERAQAETVARELRARVEPRFRGISDSSPGVIVIVTKNYDGLG